ncbi:tRNA 2-selenouridine(34) synthase MnmH [Deferribacter autotrophicus]|uniref:tRNA 2-selenouridine(34) synthase MnmH n=1 Tax=Deferribacter autotrophicus TaxID=500465 RepID=A0A5A8F8J2_9BACT|nr:tRNA 2-selenouridine(34) synthase MnmH [Deferribacter autotrophicus]KAA0258593.1 tRNA 2-selenouridine(34) synthase MnmH [Deferribacter autotrophicus]
MLYIEEVILEDVLNKGLSNFNLIDVRSPSEFLEDHLPNAVNIPILDDEERAIIGTIYKKEGAHTAKFKGIEIVSPKLPTLMNQVKDIVTKNNKNTIMYCWRGGDRSEAMVAFSKLSGLNVSKLKGGYKTFRKFVFNFFEYQLGSSYKPKTIVIYGPTGSAKTTILRTLKSEDFPIIDLEGGAAHKGSSFGFIGEPEFPHITQKYFETKIWKDFYDSNYNNFVILEGESKKIGKVTIPNSLFNMMNTGISILVNPSIDFRVKYTLDNYLPYSDENSISIALSKIKKYLGQQKVSELFEYYKQKRYSDFVYNLLVNYYDPLYKKSLPAKIDYIITYESIEEGLKNVKEIYSTICGSCSTSSI